MVEEINKLNANEQSQTTHNNMDESQVILREKNQVPKNICYMIPLFKTQKQAKLISAVRTQDSGCSWELYSNWKGK